MKRAKVSTAPTWGIYLRVCGNRLVSKCHRRCSLTGAETGCRDAREPSDYVTPVWFRLWRTPRGRGTLAAGYVLCCSVRRRQLTERTATLTGAMAPTKPLTALDLCDRCGAQAYVRVLLANRGELLFCAHHGREHSAALAKVAVDIQDESNRLSEPSQQN